MNQIKLSLAILLLLATMVNSRSVSQEIEDAAHNISEGVRWLKKYVQQLNASPRKHDIEQLKTSAAKIETSFRDAERNLANELSDIQVDSERLLRDISKLETRKSEKNRELEQSKLKVANLEESLSKLRIERDNIQASINQYKRKAAEAKENVAIAAGGKKAVGLIGSLGSGLIKGDEGAVDSAVDTGLDWLFGRKKREAEGDSPELGCTTTSGPDPNKACIIPFKFDGITQNYCTTDGNDAGDTKAWCSTMVDVSGEHVGDQGSWGVCEPKCQPENFDYYNYYEDYSEEGAAVIDFTTQIGTKLLGGLEDSEKRRLESLTKKLEKKKVELNDVNKELQDEKWTLRRVEAHIKEIQNQLRGLKIHLSMDRQILKELSNVLSETGIAVNRITELHNHAESLFETTEIRKKTYAFFGTFHGAADDVIKTATALSRLVESYPELGSTLLTDKANDIIKECNEIKQLLERKKPAFSGFS